MPDPTPEQRGHAAAADARRLGIRDLTALIADLEQRPPGHARLVDLAFARHQLARLTTIEEQEAHHECARTGR